MPYDPTSPEAAKAATIASEAEKRIDLHWPQPEYVAAVLPNDPPAQAMINAKTLWSCGLDAIGVLKTSGVDAPELDWPFSRFSGLTFEVLENIGRRAKAIEYTPTEPPEPGDIACLDHGTGHVSCAIGSAKNASGSTRVRASDGGQVWPDDGSRAILERVRDYAVESGRLVARDVTVKDGVEHVGAAVRVLWIIRGGKLPVKLEM